LDLSVVFFAPAVEKNHTFFTPPHLLKSLPAKSSHHYINHSPYQQDFHLSKDARPKLCRFEVVYLNINRSYSSDCNGVGTCILGNGNIQSSSSDKDASIFESKEGSVTKVE